MTPKEIADEVARDVTFNRTTMIAKRMECLGILVKWQSRKYDLKQEIYRMTESAEALHEGILETVMRESEVVLTKTSAAKLVSKHPDWITFQNTVKMKELVLEAIEDAIATIKSLGYALKDMHLMLHDENL